MTLYFLNSFDTKRVQLLFKFTIALSAWIDMSIWIQLSVDKSQDIKLEVADLSSKLSSWLISIKADAAAGRCRVGGTVDDLVLLQDAGVVCEVQ